MNQVIAYIRVSTDKQDSNNQHHELLTYAHQKRLDITEFIEISIGSRKTTKDRRIDELLEKLQAGDILLVTEISRLGRSTAEVIGTVNEILKKKVRLIAIKNSLDVSNKEDIGSKVTVAMFSLIAEIERDLISRRTKEALAAKRRLGVRLGKPKGTIQRSKFDSHESQIRELLTLGLSVRKIAKFLGLSNHIGLNNYINKRKLRDGANVVSLESKKASQRPDAVLTMAA